MSLHESTESAESPSLSSIDEEKLRNDVEKQILSILRIHKKLSEAEDLRPCNGINDLFYELVGLCTVVQNQEVTQMVLNDVRIAKIVPGLRTICASAECLLESHWARKLAITNHSSVKKTSSILSLFPYYDNYVDLTRMEIGGIFSLNPSPKRIAFIGSGPLPMSSLCILLQLNRQRSFLSSLFSYLHLSKLKAQTTILNIDHNPDAITEARSLYNSLDSSVRGMSFTCGEAGGSELSLRGFDVVYLAALVGTTQRGKEDVLVDVVSKMKEGSLLVVRSAHSLRTLLYPEFDMTTDTITAHLELCLTIHPHNHIVNSAIIGRVRKRQS